MLQNTIIWRARLPIQTLPKDESHVFFGGNMTALYYPISQDTLVWTVTASAARLQEVGLEVKLHSSGSQKTEDKLPVESASSHHQQLSHQLSASEVTVTELKQGCLCTWQEEQARAYALQRQLQRSQVLYQASPRVHMATLAGCSCCLPAG